MTWLQRLRLFLGIATEADKRAAHVEMLRNIQDAINEADRRDVHTDETTSLADVTRRERPAKR